MSLSRGVEKSNFSCFELKCRDEVNNWSEFTERRKMAMLRGYQRRLVMIRTGGSKIFESAFFILRSGSVSLPKDEMVDEAKRLVEECNLPRKRAKKLSFKHILFSFLLGLLLGGASLGAVWLTCVL